MWKRGALLAGLVLAAASASAQTVVVVRHAEKSAADPADRNPSLSEAGRARAEILAGLVRDWNVAAVLGSQFKRTVETGEPAARQAGLAVEPVAIGPGGAAGQAEAVAARVRALKPGQTALVVGHSNTVPLLLKALGGPDVPDLPECRYDSMFVLDVPTGTMSRRTYGAPSACR
ncbi:MAG TPA: histidine phosphatase family protein [Azospirillaceae bacterium]|nr:histidine phosphatase family protein [Azospirillaceae bacterium]